jgi:hypothetical protein
MILRGWRPVEKTGGTLRGFASVELPIGLILLDCPVHVSRGRPWAALPGRPVIDDAGRHADDPKRPSKKAWVAMAKWTDRDIAERWSQRVIELVRGAFPNDLENEEPSQ